VLGVISSISDARGSVVRALTSHRLVKATPLGLTRPTARPIGHRPSHELVAKVLWLVLPTNLLEPVLKLSTTTDLVVDRLLIRTRLIILLLSSSTALISIWVDKASSEIAWRLSLSLYHWLPLLVLVALSLHIMLSSRVSIRCLAFFFLVLELCNQTVSRLSALISALVCDVLSIDKWQVFELVDIVALDNKHSASDFDDVIDLEWMQLADLPLCTQPQPGSISAADVLQIEALWLVWAPIL